MLLCSISSSLFEFFPSFISSISTPNILLLNNTFSMGIFSPKPQLCLTTKALNFSGQDWERCSLNYQKGYFISTANTGFPIQTHYKITFITPLNPHSFRRCKCVNKPGSVLVSHFQPQLCWHSAADHFTSCLAWPRYSIPLMLFFLISCFPGECRAWLSSFPCSAKWSSFPSTFMCSKSKLLQYLKQRSQGTDRSLLTSCN